MEKVLLLLGSYPPDKCGVGDYSYKLYQSLSQIKDLDVSTIIFEDWSFSKIISIVNELRKIEYDILHIQYPSRKLVGKLSVFLILFMVKKDIIVTIHEYSTVGWKAKLLYKLFFIRAKKIIFTNNYEKEFAIRKNRLFSSKYHVIPIGSNISKNKNGSVEKKYDFVYFGIIDKTKGIKKFVNFAKVCIEQRINYRFLIIGYVPDSEKIYFNELCKESKNLSIEIRINQTNEEVSSALNSTKYAFLPFPDGVSFRRGSFLACIENGVLVFTTKGKFTDTILEKASIIIENEEEILDIVTKKRFDENLINISINEILRVTSWENIAHMHYDVYTKNRGKN